MGLVYVALAAADAECCQRHAWQGDRLGNKEQSAEAALRLLRSYLQERQGAPAKGSQGRLPSQRGPAFAFVNEPVTAEVREVQGEIAVPTAFVWRARRYKIDSWGRESSECHEGRLVRCYLVQTAGPETWELCQDAETAQWTLTRHWAGRFQFV